MVRLSSPPPAFRFTLFLFLVWPSMISRCENNKQAGGPEECPFSRQVLRGHHVHPSSAGNDCCIVRGRHQHVKTAGATSRWRIILLHDKSRWCMCALRVCALRVCVFCVSRILKPSKGVFKNKAPSAGAPSGVLGCCWRVGGIALFFRGSCENALGGACSHPRIVGVSSVGSGLSVGVTCIDS